jgi:hypothetical protein
VTVRHGDEHAVRRPLHAEGRREDLVQHADAGRAEEVVGDHHVHDARGVAGLRHDVLDVRELEAAEVVHRDRPDGVPAAERHQAVGVQLRDVRRVVDRREGDDARQHLGRVRRRLARHVGHPAELEEHLVADLVERGGVRRPVGGEPVVHVPAGDVGPGPARDGDDVRREAVQPVGPAVAAQAADAVRGRLATVLGERRSHQGGEPGGLVDGQHGQVRVRTAAFGRQQWTGAATAPTAAPTEQSHPCVPLADDSRTSILPDRPAPGPVLSCLIKRTIR